MNNMQLTTRIMDMCLVLQLLSAQMGLSQEIPVATRQAILRAQDSRDALVLLGFLRDESPLVRERAALAAASVQDTLHILALRRLLDDESVEVREGAALALGQMNPAVDSVQRRRVSDALLRRLAAEQDEYVIVRIVEGLGRVGDATSLTALLLRANSVNPGSLEWEIALSIGRYAYRGIKDKNAVAYAVRLLDLSAGPDKWKAAYALMRVGDKDLLEGYVSRLAAAAQSPDPNVKMFIATALGRLLDKKVAQLTVVKLAESDLDWRVRVNAIKALGNADPLEMPSAGLTVVQAMEDQNEHISLTALITLRNMKLAATEVSSTVRSILVEVVENADGRFSVRQQTEAAVTMAKLLGAQSAAFLHDKAERRILQQKSYAEALGFISSEEARSELFTLASQPDSRLQRIALEAMVSSCKTPPVSASAQIRCRGALQKALTSRDLAVLTTAADALADSIFADRSSVPELLSAFDRLKEPDDVEPMVAIMKALGELKQQMAVPTLVAQLKNPDRTVAAAAAEALEKITGSPHKQLVASHSKSLTTNYDWSLLDWISKHPEIRVRTSRGDFTMKMIPDEAPLTCINFASLIKKKFFDGLTFHRVVPNFVVQGGDPRGDGWGGPGYAIRSEFGYATYDRAFVGVASSGKDTEGCQFFVTQSRTPHLDGRYTIFAKVSSGMGVVDLLQVGDRMEGISFQAGDPGEGK